MAEEDILVNFSNEIPQAEKKPSRAEYLLSLPEAKELDYSSPEYSGHESKNNDASNNSLENQSIEMKTSSTQTSSVTCDSYMLELKILVDCLHEKMLRTMKSLENHPIPNAKRIKPSMEYSSEHINTNSKEINQKRSSDYFQNEIFNVNNEEDGISPNNDLSEDQNLKIVFFGHCKEMLPIVEKISYLVQYLNVEQGHKLGLDLTNPTGKDNTPITQTKPLDTYVKQLKFNKDMNKIINHKIENNIDLNLQNVHKQLIAADQQEKLCPNHNVLNANLSKESFSENECNGMEDDRNLDNILFDPSKYSSPVRHRADATMQQKHYTVATKPMVLDSQVYNDHPLRFEAFDFEKEHNGIEDDRNLENIHIDPRKYSSPVRHRADATMQHVHYTVATKSRVLQNQEYDDHPLRHEAFNFDDYLSTLKRVHIRTPTTARERSYAKNKSLNKEFDSMDYYSKLIHLRNKSDQLKQSSSGSKAPRTLNTSTNSQTHSNDHECPQVFQSTTKNKLHSSVPRIRRNSQNFLNVQNQSKAVDEHEQRFEDEVQDRFYFDIGNYFEKMKNSKSSGQPHKAVLTSRVYEAPKTKPSKKYHPASNQKSASFSMHEDAERICNNQHPLFNSNEPRYKMKKETPTPIRETFRKFVQMFSPSRYFK